MPHPDEKLVEAFLAAGPVPVDPKLPDAWDNTPNEERPICHMKLVDQPYIVTMPPHGYGGVEHERYNLRVLDLGAWDRSTNRGVYDTVEEAKEAAVQALQPGGDISKWIVVRDRTPYIADGDWSGPQPGG